MYLVCLRCLATKVIRSWTTVVHSRPHRGGPIQPVDEENGMVEDLSAPASPLPPKGLICQGYEAVLGTHLLLYVEIDSKINTILRVLIHKSLNTLREIFLTSFSFSHTVV